MSLSTVAIKGIGLAGLGVIGYDTFHMAKRRSMYKTRADVSGDLADILVRNTASGNGSKLTEDLRKGYMRWRMDDNIIPTAQYAKNTVTSTFESLTLKMVGVGLALIALCSRPAHSKGIKGALLNSRAGLCAGALVVLGAGSFLKNVLGVGQDNPKGIF